MNNVKSFPPEWNEFDSNNFGGDSTTEVILKSSTAGSSKSFKITVDDSGTLTATEIV